MASRAGRPSETWHPGCCPTLKFRGLRIAHCAACHHTFSGPNGFDVHKRLTSCREPADCGMVEQDGIWRFPARESLIAWLAKVK